MDDEEIFDQVIQMTTSEERVAWLDRVCRGCDEQRARLERLVHAHFQPDPFLDGLPQDLAKAAASELAEEAVGTWIGPYHLLKRIGEGGMGVVYEASQTTPVHRQVALKVIRPGMDTAKIIGRLETERQALAMMNHPNITRMLDAGTTESGLPYFVMDLVHGIPITTFCDTQALSVRERLALFITLCQAIHHAHQKGIIHRDLKPGNVLVDLESGSLKVIDFGVAKAIAHSSVEWLAQTDTNLTVGTPLYMSPEQHDLENQDIDTRSDVYALGILLYEISAGVNPFDREALGSVSTVELHRTLRDTIPVHPIARLGALEQATLKKIAVHRRVTPSGLMQLLGYELDWIVMKCLEKDRHRRYESASALAHDLQRYLDDFPVLGSPKSNIYLLNKFVVRHQVGAAVAVLVFLTILSASAISIWKYLDEREARRELETQRNIAVQSGEILTRYLYASDMALAMDAAANGYVSKMQALLERHKPIANKSDIRGFAWYFLNHLMNDTEQMRQSAVISRGHSSDVYFVTESPDGSMIASASKDHSIRLWNAKTGELVRIFSGHTDEVNCVSFSPDGQTLASASDDRTVRFWQVNTGMELWSLSDFQQIVIRVQFSPDGKVLATTEARLEAAQVTTTIWDVVKRTSVFRLDNQLVLRFAPNGTLIATVGEDLIIRIVDFRTNTILTTMSRIGDLPPSGVFSHDGKTLYTCGDNSIVLSFDVETGRETHRFHCQDIRPRSIALSRDGRFLAVGGNEGIVRVFHLTSGQLYASIDVPQQTVWSIAYSQDGKRLIAGCSDGSVHQWTLPTRAAITSLPPLDLPTIDFEMMRSAISPDTSLIATVVSSNRLAVSSLSPMDEESECKTEMLEIDNDPDTRLCSVDFVAGGQHILVGDSSGVLRTIDRLTGLKLEEWEIHEEHMSRAAILQRANLLATVKGLKISLWNLVSHGKGHQFCVAGGVHDISFSPDATKMIVAHSDGTNLFDLSNGDGVVVGVPRYSPVSCSVFSPNGRYFAIGQSDRTITIWDAASLAERTKLIGHKTAVVSLAYSPDSKILASGTTSGQIKLWDLETNQEFFELRGPSGPISAIAFSADGQTLVSAGVSSIGHGEIWKWSAPHP